MAADDACYTVWVVVELVVLAAQHGISVCDGVCQRLRRVVMPLRCTTESSGL